MTLGLLNPFQRFIALSKILASSSCQPEFDVVPMILPLWYHLGIFMLQIRFYHLYKCWVEFIYEISFLNTLWIKITITITITITKIIPTLIIILVQVQIQIQIPIIILILIPIQMQTPNTNTNSTTNNPILLVYSRIQQLNLNK